MKKTLVIMAAGMGSRFGGVKQIEPVGPNGEIISDYNIYDAIRNGFNKVVFIIRKEHEEIFRNNIVSKYKDKIEVEFAFQEMDTFDLNGRLPIDRVKMLGTIHAILCAKDVIDEDFAVINADDYYGNESFNIANTFLNTYNDFSLTINYPVETVVTGEQKVKRGICVTNENQVLDVIESEIYFDGKYYIGNKLDEEESFVVNPGTGCSMNFFVFRKSLLNKMEIYFDNFMNNISLTNECLISIFLNDMLASKEILLKELITDSKWLGMTYKDDMPYIKEQINELINNGVYNTNLWGE